MLQGNTRNQKKANEEAIELRNKLLPELGSIYETINDLNKDFRNYVNNNDVSSNSAIQSIIDLMNTNQETSMEKINRNLEEIKNTFGENVANSFRRYLESSERNMNIVDSPTITKRNLKLTQDDLNELRRSLKGADSAIMDMIKTINRYNIVVDQGIDTYKWLAEYISVQRQRQQDLDRQVKDVIYLKNRMSQSGEAQLFEETMYGTQKLQELFDTIVDSIGGQGLIDEANRLGVDVGAFKVDQKDEWIRFAKENRRAFNTLMSGFTDEEGREIINRALDNMDYILTKFGVDLGTITAEAIVKAKTKIDNAYKKAEIKYSLESAKVINDEIDKYNKHLKDIREAYKKGNVSLEEAASDLEESSIEMQYFLLHAKKIRAQTMIEQGEFFSQKAYDEAIAAYRNNDIEGFNQAVEDYDKWEAKIQEGYDAITSAGKELFDLGYTETFRRFNEELKKFQDNFNNTLELNEALKKTGNGLFNLKETKEQIKYSQQMQRLLQDEIDKRREWQKQIDPSNYTKIREIEEEIYELEQQITQEKIKQIQATNQMVDDSFNIVVKVADRIQREIDTLQFNNSIRDRITDINDLRLQMMELKEVWNAADLNINWDSAFQRTWESIPRFINNIDTTIDRYEELLEVEDQLANLADERRNLTDEKAIEESYRKQAELISQAVISAKESAKLEQEKIDALNEQLRLAKQQQANQQYAYNMLIKQKQEELEALQDQKDAEEEIDEVLRLRLELIKAMDDTSHSYITGAGIEIMRPDPEKIDEARGNLEEKKREDLLQDQIDALQDEIDRLQEEKDRLDKMADAVIAGYEYEIQIHQDELDRLIDFADRLTSSYEEMMNGIPPIILEQLRAEWKEQVATWDQFRSNLDNWFNEELSGNFMTPIMDSLENWADKYNTGLENQEAIVDRIENILEEDFAKHIDYFNEGIDKFVDSLDELRNLGEDYINDLHSVLSDLGGSRPSGVTTDNNSNMPDRRPVSDDYDEKPVSQTKPASSRDIKIGKHANVKNGIWYGTSQGGGDIGRIRNGPFTITNYVPGAKYPVHLSQGNGLPGGWITEDLIINTYKKGGLADFTGPAWLDGTKQNPEIVLNSDDTRNFLQLTELLRRTELSEMLNNMRINTDQTEITSILRQIASNLKNQNIEQRLYIDNVNLPEVSNANDFIDGLASFVNYGRRLT